ncbi:Uncharacterised protein [Pseudomonas aeruginosa]|nr:Uncharacterised protein [Pseudomonas aeruginosa]
MAVGFPFYATGHPRHARQLHAMPEGLRPATTADRPRRSAGRHPHIRAPAARRHRNARRMPGHSAPPARRRPAPMGCGAPGAGRRGGRGRRSRRRAGVVPCWTRCRAPGSARTRGCSPGTRAGSALPAPGRRHRRAGRRRRFPAGSRGSSFPGSLMARVMAAPPGDCAHAGPVPWAGRRCRQFSRFRRRHRRSIALNPRRGASPHWYDPQTRPGRRECPARLPINCSNA